MSSISLKKGFATLCALSTVSSFAYATPKVFFQEILNKHYVQNSELELRSISEDTQERSLAFKEVLKPFIFDKEENPEIHELRFKTPGHLYSCFGAIVKESERLLVSKLPKEYQDRAGQIVVGNCLDILYQEKSDQVLSLYNVFPLDKTLPIGNLELADAYPIYQTFLKSRPSVICTDNDMNSEGVPRGQTLIHHIDDKVSFYTGISRSSPSQETDDGVIWSNDRAIFIEEADHGTLPEIEATMDYLSLHEEGNLHFVFDKANCVEAKNEGMLVMACFTDVPKERATSFQPNKKYSDVPLTLNRVQATIESKKVTRITMGVNNTVGSIEETEYRVSYLLRFSSEKGQRHLRVTTNFKNTPMESTPECRSAESN